MTTELSPSGVVEQFRNDPEKVRRTIQDLVNLRYELINESYPSEEKTKKGTKQELDFYKSLFTWETSFEIGGRYQLPYSVNVCLKCKSEKDFITILKDGYEGCLDPSHDGEKNAPSIEYEYGDLICGDFHCLEPEAIVDGLSLKEDN